MFHNLHRLIIGGAGVLAVIALTHASPSHAGVLIDDFNDNQPCSTISDTCQLFGDDDGAGGNFEQFLNPRTFGAISGDGGSAIGDRTLYAEQTSGDGVVEGRVQSGHYNHDQAAGASGFSQITWSNFGGVGGTVDFTGVMLAINVLVNDNGGNVIVRVSSDGGATFSSQTITLAALEIGEKVYDLDTFGGPATLTAINWIQLEVDGRLSSELDLEIDIIAQVPEPATLALFGIGLLGIGLIYRRRRDAGSVG